MYNFKFISHESFPEDQYTKEIVYLEVGEKEKYRVGYARKQSKNGGMFWSVISAGVTKNGNKIYKDSFIIDSNIQKEDIKAFLESRGWEKKLDARYEENPPF
jgi:hypothetical protein